MSFLYEIQMDSDVDHATFLLLNDTTEQALSQFSTLIKGWIGFPAGNYGLLVSIVALNELKKGYCVDDGLLNGFDDVFEQSFDVYWDGNAFTKGLGGTKRKTRN